MRGLAARLRQPLGFALVGCAGFATHALVYLALTQWLPIPGLAAWPMAFVPASLVTWQLNRHFVFRTRASAGRRRDEYLRHLTLQSLGIAVNFGAFWLAVRTGLGQGNGDVVPLAIGSLVAMVFNYLGSRRFVFRR